MSVVGKDNMAELIALYIVWKNIGSIARSRGVKAQPFQVKAVIRWFVFEFVCAFLAGAMGLQGIFIYLAAFAGALLSVRFSFNAVRAAAPKPAIAAASQRDDDPKDQ
jgi:hypothetical protein